MKNKKFSSGEETVKSQADELIEKAKAGAGALPFQGGDFALCLDLGTESVVMKDKSGKSKVFPKIENLAKYLKRNGIESFVVDIKIWRDDFNRS